MAYGYLVLDKSYKYDQDYSEFYLEKRQEIFGIAAVSPEWVVSVGKDPTLGIPILRLQSAHLGLLQTYEQALKLLEILREKFPERPLEIVVIENESATELRFYLVQ
jgi:hypothetical protein